MDQLKNRGLEIPLIQGGMGVGVSLSGLAGAVAKTGAMGCIEEVFLRGKLVAKGGKVLLENQGKYLKRKKFQPVV